MHPSDNNQGDLPTSYKANKILHLSLVALFLIVLRIWHLTVIQHDEKEEAARKPQVKTIFIPAQRGTIRDRFNTPLAINKIQYNAAINYGQLRQIPAVAWIKDPIGGKPKRTLKRREYIKALAQKVSEILELDSERLEDLIHSKASLYYQVPYTIKEAITEEQYYRLKMMEKDWLGLQPQRLCTRYYPYGRAACDILGYMGPIDRKKFDAIASEIRSLENILLEGENDPEIELPLELTNLKEVEERVNYLKQKAYAINDSVGKTGIEGRFEADLRGFYGIARYYSDAKGNFLRQLPGAISPLPGDRLILSLSIELQQFAEKLLIQNEAIRPPKVTDLHSATKEILKNIREPWMKGGAIVAMDPNSGEILALASYPRYNPNDFIQVGGEEGAKRSKARQRWLESPTYLGAIWDQKMALERERFDPQQQKTFDEKLILTWNNYLSLILSEESPVKQLFNRSVTTVGDAHILQKNVETLLQIVDETNIFWLFNILYSGEAGHTLYGPLPSLSTTNKMEKKMALHFEEVAKCKKNLENYFEGLPHNYDKILAVDLCRVAVDTRNLPTLPAKIASFSLEEHKKASAALGMVEEAIYSMAKELFRLLDFSSWRQENEKIFLQGIRKSEKEKKQYSKPYIDYLDKEQGRQFTEFWGKNRIFFLKAFILGQVDELKEAEEKEGGNYFLEYLDYFFTWHKELHNGAHSSLDWHKSYFTLKKQLSLLGGDGAVYLAILRNFSKLDRPLLGSYKNLYKSGGGIYLEKDLAAAFYPLYGFGYGRSQAYRQAATQGSIFKLVTAYEGLIQRWSRLDEKKRQDSDALNPLEIIDTVFQEGNKVFLGYDSQGNAISQMYKGGRLPRSLSRSIGRLDIVKAIETSSNPYFALLAGEVLSEPEDLARAAKRFSYGNITGIDLPAEIGGKVPQDLASNRSGLYATAIGQHTLVTTPLQTAVMLAAIANGGKVFKPKLINFRVGYKHEYNEKKPSLTPFKGEKEVEMLLGQTSFGRNRIRIVTSEPPAVRWELPMPALVRTLLLEGLKRTVARTTKNALPQLRHFYQQHPEAIDDYLLLKNELIGKTSTAESVEQLNLDRESGVNLYNHIWFGGICFPHKNGGEKKGATYVFNNFQGEAELIVVVYLRYGSYGKETAPIAAQVATKWRAIKNSPYANGS